MRFSFSTAGLFPRNSIESLKLVKKAGFRYAELMPQCLKETKPNFADEIIRETSVKVGSIHFPLVFFSMFYNPYPGMLVEVKELMDGLVEMGGKLGTEIIVIHPPYFPDDLTREVFERAVFDNLEYLCSKAQKNGIKIALENSPKGGRKAQDLLDVIERLNSSNIFPMVDTTEAVESGEDPLNMIDELDVIHLHISDHMDDTKHLPPGEGKIDWRSILDLLLRKKYDGLIVVEPAYRFFLKNPLDRMRKTLAFLKGMMI